MESVFPARERGVKSLRLLQLMVGVVIAPPGIVGGYDHYEYDKFINGRVG